MKTIGFAAISVLVMASLAACSGDDGQEPQATQDTGVAADTGVLDTGTTDTGTSPDTGMTADMGSDAPVVDEPKFTVHKLSETGHDRLFGVAFDSAGNIFATGSIADTNASDADSSFMVVKFKPDGTRDTTFGSMGVAKKNIIAKKGGEAARGVIAQADGKIVVAGAVEHEGATDDRDRDLALVRFNADGTVDTTFGTMGVQIHDLSTGEVVGTSFVADTFWDIKPVTGGGFFVFGSAKATGRTDSDFAVVKLKADGTKDTAWGTMGMTLVDISNRNATPKGGIVFSDGTVMMSGYWTDGDMIVRPAVFKLKADGTLDGTYGTGGIFSTSVLSLVTEVYGIAMQGTNVVTVGYGRNSMSESTDFLSLRLTPAGVLDTTYGTMGYTRIDVAMQNENARALVVLGDDRVLMVGGGRPTMATQDGMIAILKSDGKPDTTWGTGGFRTWDFGNPADMLWGVALNAAKDKVAAVGVTGGAMGGNDDAVLLTMSTPK